MNKRGSIGLVCILTVALIVLLCQSMYTLIAADYRYLKNYIRQRQAVYAATSGLQALERAASYSSTDININMQESLLPDDILTVTMSSYSLDGVRWLLCKSSSDGIEVNMVQGILDLPNKNSALYNHNLVGSIFNIEPTASIEGSVQNYLQLTDGSFVKINIAAYARHAFVLPDAEGWKMGLGRSVFVDPLGSSLLLPSSITIRGSGVFASYSDITIGAGSSYPDKMQFVANGNIVVGSNVRLDNVFILSGNTVKISQGSRVSGKIFAQRGIIVEQNVVIKDLPIADLAIRTDKYLW